MSKAFSGKHTQRFDHGDNNNHRNGDDYGDDDNDGDGDAAKKRFPIQESRVEYPPQIRWFGPALRQNPVPDCVALLGLRKYVC